MLYTVLMCLCVVVSNNGLQSVFTLTLYSPTTDVGMLPKFLNLENEVVRSGLILIFHLGKSSFFQNISNHLRISCI